MHFEVFYAILALEWPKFYLRANINIKANTEKRLQVPLVVIMFIWDELKQCFDVILVLKTIMKHLFQ